ncbi:DUF2779 domain-containing protein [Leptospira levettii]|uniref:DUF2779 domain-containing protein n=1 Tax=Leptospira levettii TaxID=2023178 RepID=UPI001AEF6C6D|nr:DUF2779 domain-containing protein [Leptospira levettii]
MLVSMSMPKPTKTRYLTKSRYQLAGECPTKLFYASNPEYANQSLEDSFLESLAEGGYQVGELAKLYEMDVESFEIEGLEIESAVKETELLLQKDKVTIFEAAIRHQNLLIRADILKKNGNQIELIEVKAKSFSGTDDSEFLNSRGDQLNSAYSSYLEDVAFQTFVLKKAYPQFRIKSYLMLANKNAKATVNGLNQIFKITQENGRKQIQIDEPLLKQTGLGEKILIKVCVDSVLPLIYDAEGMAVYEKRIQDLAISYETNTKIQPTISTTCKSCEFSCTESDVVEGKKDGFLECWTESLGLPKEAFAKPLVFELWNSRKSAQYLRESKYFLEDLSEEDLTINPSEDDTLSTSERQWLQLKKVLDGDNSVYLNNVGLKFEMDRWKFPLHFIDFETSTVAIPFYQGMSPYEEVAFQFSHHVVNEDGSVEHKGQYLSTEPGVFPNFDFVRHLKQELESDDGTIFRYSNHENTILNRIIEQLVESTEPDKQELIDWIKTITHSGGKNENTWVGDRDMVDLCEIVKKYHYDPRTKGSNSIKAVLPAVLNSSSYLQSIYNKPIYGNDIKSLNFKDKVWLEIDPITKEAINPYDQLPDLFQGIEIPESELSLANQKKLERLSDGGAALTAFAFLQFMDCSERVRTKIKEALLKYCELDTLAMVFIYQYFRHEVDLGNKKDSPQFLRG